MPDEISMGVNDFLDGLSVQSKELQELIRSIQEIHSSELLTFGPIPIGRYIVLPLKRQSDAVRFLENILDQDLRRKVKQIITCCPLTGACLSIQKWIREESISIKTIYLENSLRCSLPAAAEYGTKIRLLPNYSSGQRPEACIVVICEVELIAPMLRSLFDIPLRP